MYPYPSVEAARAMVAWSSKKKMGPNAEAFIAKMTAEKVERERLCKLRFWRFVRAMKRLGYLDYRKIDTRNIVSLEKMILEEIANDDEVDPDPKYWTLIQVVSHLWRYLDGWCPMDYFGPELGDQIRKIIDSDLGKGDVLSESLTPDAIFERLDDQLKADIPFHAVYSYMLRAQERELLLRRLRAQAEYPLLPTCSSLTHDSMDIYYTEETEESPYRRMRTLEIEKKLRTFNDKYRIFLKAVNRLGGDENIANITAKAMYKVIFEELDTSEDMENPFWTVEKLEQELTRHKLGEYPTWTCDHHNRMLEAVDKLGGDPSNEKLVNAKVVLELMDPDGTMDDPMTLSGVKHQLEILREALKRDPFDPLGYPEKPSKKFCSYFCWTPQEILEVAKEI